MRHLLKDPELWRTGAFVGGELVGVAGYSRHTNPKQAHKATLFGMYVNAAYQQQGLGRQWPGVPDMPMGAPLRPR